MPEQWERFLKRWSDAGLIDAGTVVRIGEFEGSRDKSTDAMVEPVSAAAGSPTTSPDAQPGLRLPIIIAIGFGCLLLAAGVLLFVAAHWDELSPAARFMLVLLFVGGFHLAAGFATDKFPHLATGLHGVGTIALGAGIFLAGQIFNLQEHWPGGLLLWAIGAWAAWFLLRDWVEASLLAMLAPAWLASEWFVFTENYHAADPELAMGILALAFTYISANTPGSRNHVRRALSAIGAVVLIPSVLAVLFAHPVYLRNTIPVDLRLFAGIIGMGAALALAWWLRGTAAWINGLAVLWVLVLSMFRVERHDTIENLGIFGWCALGAVGLTAWGLAELDKRRIDFGVIAFAITVVVFYFSNVMNMMGRSSALISLGLLFLVGGWLLEKTRRNLVARIANQGGTS